MTSELEYANEKAVNKVGEETVIRFLNDISSKMNFKAGLEYQFFESIVTQYFSVKTKELYNSNTEENVVNCRKLLCYMLLKHTDMKDAAVSYLVNVTPRTLSRYKKKIFDLIEKPMIDPALFKAYEYLDSVLTKHN